MKQPSVRNPLSAIALFVGFSEAVLLGVLKLSNDPIFNYLVGISMILLALGTAICFFFILIRNPGNLYAPGDFKDESNYMTLNNRLKDMEAFTKIIDKKIEEMPIYIFSKLPEEGIRVFLTAYHHIKFGGEAKEANKVISELIGYNMEPDDIKYGIKKLVENGWLSNKEDPFSLTYEGETAYNILKEFVYGRWG